MGRRQAQGGQAQLGEPRGLLPPRGRLKADGLGEAGPAPPTRVQGPRIPQQQPSGRHDDAPGVLCPPRRELRAARLVVHRADLAIVDAVFTGILESLVLHHGVPAVVMAAGPQHGRGGSLAGGPDVEHALVCFRIAEAVAHVVLVLVDVGAERVGLGDLAALRREKGNVHTSDKLFLFGKQGAEHSGDVRMSAGSPSETPVHQGPFQHEARALSEVCFGGPYGERSRPLLQQSLVRIFRCLRARAQGLLVHEVEEVVLEVVFERLLLLEGNDTRHNGEPVLVQYVLQSRRPLLQHLIEGHVGGVRLPLGLHRDAVRVSFIRVVPRPAAPNAHGEDLGEGTERAQRRHGASNPRRN
mmetsp:Transcript_23376/g.70192  ORF Transcript_23376/g.70192 Transcript_23376/m.70192 type:complete len:355 (-) Transcript_23376:41-1105(-)